ncbi:MAG TPA: hypothetical protein DCE48_14920 [Lachnospiraceae bacterium]|nr:hypothetical protein [Lachnospiraceae bacterium]
MKTIIMYYTFGGSSRKEANRIADENDNSVLCEIKEENKRNIITAFFSGCPKAIKREQSSIQKIEHNLDNFDKIILVAPVWAGFPAPAFNSMVELLPSGKEVEVYLCSGGGETPKSQEGTGQIIRDKSCNLIAYHNIKTTKK